MKKKEPVRMCVACKRRESQKNLLRLQQKGDQLVVFSGSGRSLYLCFRCIQDQKKYKGLIKRFKLEEASFVKFLKEFIPNG
ncbi:MAG TPA: DUF448 domain-containing protein [Epsilonproteobacteria bacterium]|nr:DUF448 domain-containing protein [Campylobacterota bacterium]